MSHRELEKLAVTGNKSINESILIITFVKNDVYYSTNNNLYYNIDLKKTSRYLMIREHKQI